MIRVLKIILSVIAVLAFLAVGLLLIITRTPIVKDQAVGYLSGKLGHGAVEIDAGRVAGDLINGLSLDDVVIVLKDVDPPDTIAHIANLSVEYDLLELLREPHLVRRITAVEPRILLPYGPFSALRQRLVSDSSGDGEEGSPLPDLRVEMLSVVNGIVERRGEAEPMASGVNLHFRVEHSGGEWTVRVLPSIAQTAPWGTLSVEGKLMFRDDALSVDSVMIRTERSDISASGTPEGLRLRAQPVDFADIDVLVSLGVSARLDYVGTIAPRTERGEWAFDGMASGQIEGYRLSNLDVAFSVSSEGLQFDRLSGRVSGARWNGTGYIDLISDPECWGFQGGVRDFDLMQFAPGTLASDLSGNVRITAEGVTDETLAISAGIDLGPGHFDHIEFDEARGDIFVTTDSVVFADGFRMTVRETEFVGAGTVDYDDSLDVFANVVCSDLHLWDRSIFIDSLEGTADGYIYLSGLTADPDLSGVAYSDSLRMYDLSTKDFQARFYVPQFLSERSGTVEARWGESSTWGVATDSIGLEATLTGTRVDITWGRWSSPYVRVEGAGCLDWAADTIPIRLFPFSVLWEGQSYTVSDSITIVIDSVGFDLGAPEFRGPLGILNAEGRIDYDNTMDLDLDVRRFRLEAFWRRFFPDIPLAGLIATRGHVGGTFDLPRFSLSGTVTNLEYDERPFGDLQFDLSYRDRRLSVRQARLDNPDFHVDVTGTFPIDLAFRPVERRVLDLPLVGRLSSAGEVLDRIASFQPDVLESVRGPFAVSAALSGTPLAPRLIGDAHLRAGRIKALEIVDPIESVQIDLSLRQDTILIERAVGTVGEKGGKENVRATGTLRIESYNEFAYDLRLIGSRVPAQFEFEDFTVETDFDLTVRGSTPPVIAGRLNPQRVDDREPFDPDPPNRIPDTTLWDWDLTIDLPGNYWIHNDQIEAEMSAELRLRRQQGLVDFIGTAEIIRGKVYLLDKVGRITRGELYFDDPTNPDPRLDIDVVFRIHQPRVESTGPGSSQDVVDLELHVAGRASEPLIQPEPPYSEQDVLLLLTANTTAASGGDPLMDRLRFGATGLLFSELQRVMARRLGLQTFEIESGVDPRDTRITVGLYTTPHLYLYGTSPVHAGGEQELGFEYRFSRHLFLEGNRDKDNLYRLNLHFNWDY
jgi:autotransporter translocation and assembly factor TamB